MATSKMPFKAVLLDIEGTTTPISFVTDVLFPYAKSRYSSYIKEAWSTPGFIATKQIFSAEDPAIVAEPETLITFVEEKHDKNEKHTAFKRLQGDLWKSGYEDGSLKSIVYQDVPLAIDSWAKQDIMTYIYSSGSIPAQKLLFQYTQQGDLRPKLSGYFDTSTAGPKTVSSSYTAISKQTGIEPADWLFLSDNVKEVVAAKEAGMKSYVVHRPGNADLSDEEKAKFKSIRSFAEI